MHLMGVCMNKNIFREYDIRGIADEDLTDDVVFEIGKSFGYYLRLHKHDSLSISGDVRDTTDRIKNSFIKGAISQNINVYDMGVLPTPANYFSLYNTDIHNSVQVTGSHNPSDYNGFKITYNKKPFYGEDIQLLLDGKETRRNVGFYNIKILNQSLKLLSVLIILIYLLFTLSPEVIIKFTDKIYMTTIFVIIGLYRYLYLTLVKNHSGDPTKIFLWHANYHPDGGQLFFPTENKPFICPLALPTDDIEPEHFKAFYCDGSKGLYIHPNIWHEGVFPINQKTSFMGKQGKVHARVSIDFKKELNKYLFFKTKL